MRNWRKDHKKWLGDIVMKEAKEKVSKLENREDEKVNESEKKIEGNKKNFQKFVKIRIKKEKLKKVFNKKVLTSLFGLSIIVFSIIGVVVTVKNLYIGVVRMINHSAQKEGFEKYVLPVLMFDPVPFDDIKKVDEFSLLRSAIWAAFINNGKEKYWSDEYNSFIIPSSDVDVNIVALYGEGLNIKHQTFGDGLMNNYIYDEKTKTYTMPIYDQVGVYSPQVENIYKNKDIYTLTIGYIRPADVWQTYINDAKKITPEKYMEYVLKLTDDGYNIIAIKDSSWNDKLLDNDSTIKE